MGSFYANIKHRLELIQIHDKRLKIIQKQLSVFGSHGDTNKLMEKDDLEVGISHEQDLIGRLIFEFIAKFDEYIMEIDDIEIDIIMKDLDLNKILKRLNSIKKIYIKINEDGYGFLVCRLIMKQIRMNVNNILPICIDFHGYEINESIDDWIVNMISIANSSLTEEDVKNIFVHGFDRWTGINDDQMIINYIPVILFSCPEYLIKNSGFIRKILPIAQTRKYPICIISSIKSDAFRGYPLFDIEIKHRESSDQQDTQELAFDTEQQLPLEASDQQNVQEPAFDTKQQPPLESSEQQDTQEPDFDTEQQPPISIHETEPEKSDEF